MTLHVALTHITHYRYDKAINLGPHVVRLRPAPHSRTPIKAYSIKIDPVDHFLNWQQDPFANHLARLVFPKPTTEFKVTVELIAEMASYNPFDFFLEPKAEHFPFDYEPALRHELAPYLECEAATPEFAQYLAKANTELRKPKQRSMDFLVALNQRVQGDVKYLIRMEPGVQTPERTLTQASGSCRDSAWLLVQLLRHMGLAARFASGYLIQLVPDVKPLEGPAGAKEDFTDLHAWCEVFLPGAGWVGLDPTSGMLTAEGHIPLACTPRPSSAAPIEGGHDKAEVTFSHHMGVTRVLESPRVTKPYTDDQWAAMLGIGAQVDQDLMANDVRLTMGGEPTFVADFNRDEPEWNTDALGPTKRGLATSLVHKLRKKYAVGGFLHFGQGKWYPGEQLPRWALSIHWRNDGQPIWRNPALFADEQTPCSFKAADARRFSIELCRRLDITPDHLQSGHEDAWYYLWREKNLPTNVDPFDSRLEDEMERVRLRRVFHQQLSTVVGYALPLAPLESSERNPDGPDSQWKTGPWFLRDERMYLIPGDSPMGWRLPVASQPWTTKSDYPYVHERDPMDEQAPLTTRINGAAKKIHFDSNKPNEFRDQWVESHQKTPSSPTSGGFSDLVQPRQPARALSIGERIAQARASTPQQGAPSRFVSASNITRTALCIETRNPVRANGPKAEADAHQVDLSDQAGQTGIVYVFMPPLAHIEDYLNLLHCIELTAEALSMPVVIEGYPPPRDARVQSLAVTPDPGVIEVNIHPAHSFAELVDNTEFLYQAAFECRLSAEKFMFDGRHSGTGGGNHITLGGANASQSPFLRKPELLTSMVSFWHNHPSLSYLFSGMFIGPTSQAPRLDEARNDALYEFEIAREQLAKAAKTQGKAPPPWLVDRSLRNLLVDITGNTHRSEFCIDKLYSPDSATGRLGIVELRAMEMPPHARMSVAQQLLIRALVSSFWRKPYTAPLSRWGTQLHDRFMLPSFVWMDFCDVLRELREAGYAFEESWFAPHFEFRFPRVGELHLSGMKIDFRNALEPWHTLGEEALASGTSRYVDSSLERLEVRVSGFNPARHSITCNGKRVPLQPAGAEGEFAGGVRFKAWSAPSALHPSIGTHVPLIFDVVDNWQSKTIAGAQVHVAHAGGLSYSSFPVNAYEAESRRLSRFFDMGHTAGRAVVPQPVVSNAGSAEHPFSLDMRRG